jgi:arylsulfatase A-like enzyme
MLAGPGIPQGSSKALVTHTDLAPTLASFAGGWFQGGVGAVPLLLDGSGDADRRVILETAWVTSLPGVRQIGLRTLKWKYMELAEGGAPALFDLEADPRERRNVVAEHRDVATLFADELRAAFAGEVVGERMSAESSAIVEQRLRDLGYFD